MSGRKLTMAVAIPCLILLLCGCGNRPKGDSGTKGSSAPRAPEGSAAVAETPGPAINLIAYVNPDGPEHQQTITVLEKLEKTYPNRLKVDIVNLQDGAEGTRRWRASGFQGMAIVVNGSATQAWSQDGKPKQVTFDGTPSDCGWTHDDLRSMVYAWVAGRAHTVKKAPNKPQPHKALPVHAQAVTQAGQPGREVTIGGSSAIRFLAAAAGASPTQRAAEAMAALNAWQAAGGDISALSTKQVANGWALVAKGKTVAVATEADAKAAKTTVSRLATAWLSAVRLACDKAEQELAKPVLPSGG